MTTYRIVIRLFILTLLSVVCVLFLSSCERNEITPWAEFLATCPYEPQLEFKSIRHHLQFPVEVHPKKVTYKVGDTLTVSMTFQDSIFDVNMVESSKFPTTP